MYSLLRKILFSMPTELSHELSMDWLGAAERLKLLNVMYKREYKPVMAMGLRFPNPVGLAAGLDKNGDYLNALGALGFGFIEIGTVTPKPQAGNPKPRLFRLPEQGAIINRMGFNNLGVEHLVEQVKHRRFDGILGINIGKNKVTPEEDALSDYLICLDAVYPYADYVTVNISSPNTPGLRNLQFGDNLQNLLSGVKTRQKQLADTHSKYVPIAVKIAPDMNEQELTQVAQCINENKMDGVIATNTTVSRLGVESSPLAQEAGGLSGAPLREQSTKVISAFKDQLDESIDIIGVGGIMSGMDARQKLDAGASLVQIYSGFIYRGPELIKEILECC